MSKKSNLIDQGWRQLLDSFHLILPADYSNVHFQAVVNRIDPEKGSISFNRNLFLFQFKHLRISLFLGSEILYNLVCLSVRMSV